MKIKNVKKAVVRRKKLHHLLKRKREVKKLNRSGFLFVGDSSDKECPSNVLIQQELNTYFAERPPSSDTEPLSWGKANTTHCCTISELAKQLFHC